MTTDAEPSPVVGVGLQSIFGIETSGRQIVEWAQRAEQLGFHSLATLDNLCADGWDPFVSLSAAAASTSRIRLATTILLLPNRNEVHVAKQLASLDALSGGRVDFGTSVGGRTSDYTTVGASFDDRGKRFEEQLTWMRAWFRDVGHTDAMPGGPRPHQAGGPPIWIGGRHRVAVARALTFGDGFVIGPVGAPNTAAAAAGVRGAAQAVGRDDLAIIGMVYCAIGEPADAALATAVTNVSRYEQLWADPAELIVHGSIEQVSARLAAFRDIGLDQLIVYPLIPGVEQLDDLATATRASGLTLHDEGDSTRGPT